MQVGKFTPSKKIHTHSIPFLAQVPVSGVHNLSLSPILISFTLKEIAPFSLLLVTYLVCSSSAYNDDPFNAQQGTQDSWLEARQAKQQRVAAKVKEHEQKERERLGVVEAMDKKSPRPARDVYKGGDARRWFT